MRVSECQSLLSEIAKVPEICFVASVDDVHAANLWSREMAERFRWWWVTCHTYGEYRFEVVAATPSKAILGPAAVQERTMRMLTSLPLKAHLALLPLLRQVTETCRKGAPATFSRKEWVALCPNTPSKHMDGWLKAMKENTIIVEKPNGVWHLAGLNAALLERICTRLDQLIADDAKKRGKTAAK